MSVLSGSWKTAGFVVPVPIALRRGIRVVHVKQAAAQVVRIDPAFCYVVIPADAPNPDKWRVSVKDGALKIRPPQVSGQVVNIASGNARVGMQIGVVHGSVRVGGPGRLPQVSAQLPTIGLVLPRQIRVLDRQQ